MTFFQKLLFVMSLFQGVSYAGIHSQEFLSLRCREIPSILSIADKPLLEYEHNLRSFESKGGEPSARNTFLGMNTRNERPLVFVSVAAYQEIVQEMAGNDIDVRTVVPPGMSFHTFEPTPSLVHSLYTADLWLIIGDPFEKKILSALQNAQHPPALIDLRQGVQMLHDKECHGCEGADPHIWTSPRMMKRQLITIKDGLLSIFPRNKEGIEERYRTLNVRIDTLIGEADEQLTGQQDKIIIIAHGAFGYLCHDFGIEQRAIEVGGKEATARSLYDLIQEAERKGVKTIFSLKQYPKKGIERVAEALHATVIDLDAYQSDYFSGMQYTIKAFHTALEQESE